MAFQLKISFLLKAYQAMPKKPKIWAISKRADFTSAHELNTDPRMAAPVSGLVAILKKPFQEVM